MSNPSWSACDACPSANHPTGPGLIRCSAETSFSCRRYEPSHCFRPLAWFSHADAPGPPLSGGSGLCLAVGPGGGQLAGASGCSQPAGYRRLDLGQRSDSPSPHFYVAPVLLALWSQKNQHAIYTAYAATGLSVLGFMRSPLGGPHAEEMTNRILSIAMVWLAAALSLQRWRREETLERAYSEMERRVRERTDELTKANASSSLKSPTGRKGGAAPPALRSPDAGTGPGTAPHCPRAA